MYLEPAIHPANKIEYADGDRVEFLVAGGPPVYRGMIIGISSSGLLDHWIIQPDKPLPDWPYRAITLQHTFIRREGSNLAFLCETVSRRLAGQA
jgi:hypothetical protein